MFIKNGDGHITSIIDAEALTEEEKKSVKKKVADKNQTSNETESK